MAVPTRKTLASSFPKLSASQVSEIHALMKAADDGKARFKDTLPKISQILGTHGVEVVDLLTRRGAEAKLHYANTGDTYDTTIGYVTTPSSVSDKRKRRWVVTSWGDWYSAMERRGYHDASEMVNDLSTGLWRL